MMYITTMTITLTTAQNLPVFQAVMSMTFASGITQSVCIKVAPRKTDWVMPDAKVMDMSAWKTGKFWAVVSVIVIVVMYVICSPLVLGA